MIRHGRLRDVNATRTVLTHANDTDTLAQPTHPRAMTDTQTHEIDTRTTRTPN